MNRITNKPSIDALCGFEDQEGFLLDQCLVFTSGFFMSLFLLLHYTSVNYSSHTKFHYTKAPAKTAPSYLSLYPLQSVVPIITLYLYIILVNTKHQSSKKPSWSSKPHKASILGLFVIPPLYFMYFNFSVFHLSTILLFSLISCKLFNHQLSTLYNTIHPLFQSLHYTLFHYTNHYYLTIYNTTILLYNNLLFQLSNPHYTNHQ